MNDVNAGELSKLVETTMTKIYAFAFFLLFGMATTAGAQEKITLEKAIETALNNNIQVKQAKLTEALSDADIKQAKANLFPTLNLSTQATENFGRNIDPSTNQFTNNAIFAAFGNLSSQVTLFQGGQRINQIRQNKLSLDADKSNTDKVKNDLTLNVVTTFLQILSNRDLLEAAKQQVTIANETLNREQKNFDAGNKTQADLSQAKAQLSTAEFDQTTAQNNLELSMLTLKQYMEYPPDREIEILVPDVEKLMSPSADYSFETVYREALNRYPDVKLADLRALATQKGIDIARGGMLPRLDLGGSLGTNYSDGRRLFERAVPNGRVDTIGFVGNQAVVAPQFDQILRNYAFNRQIGDNFNQSVGLTLSFPVFNNWQAKTQLRKAKINAQNAQYSAQLARTNLSKVIAQSVWDVGASQKKLESAERTYQSNKEAFNVIEKRYNVGLVNSLDYNTSRTNLNRSQFDLINARYDYIFKVKLIDYYIGKPITF
ncbi:MAG: TolC family protein [Mucilaginibacter polytrichastri]|nr:TolC family protein [Mucilaginibacter polytrichastri]